MIVFAGETDLDGKIQRDLLGMVGRTDLDGLIGGQVWLRGGTLAVASTAEIRGPATFEGREQPVVEAGAKLASPIRTELTQEIRRTRRTAARVVIRAIFSYAGGFGGWNFASGHLPRIFPCDIARGRQHRSPHRGWGAGADHGRVPAGSRSAPVDLSAWAREWRVRWPMRRFCMSRKCLSAHGSATKLWASRRPSRAR